MPELAVGVGLPMVTDGIGLRSVPETATLIEQVGLDHVSISDVLVGDGSPTVDCVVVATSAAAATSRVGIELGVLVTPVRATLPLATQLVTLQGVSGDRLVLGVGAGGFPEAPYWRAAGAPAEGRGARLEQALAALRPLLAGRPTTVADPECPVVLAPVTRPPPILVGGHSRAARRRAATLADGWFPSLVSPGSLAAQVADLRDHAAAAGRPVPRVHYGTHAALGPDAREQVAVLHDDLTTGMGFGEEELATVPLTGPPAAVAEQLAAYGEAGADSITVTLDGRRWRDQVEALAAARALLGSSS